MIVVRVSRISPVLLFAGMIVVRVKVIREFWAQKKGALFGAPFALFKLANKYHTSRTFESRTAYSTDPPVNSFSTAIRQPARSALNSR